MGGVLFMSKFNDFYKKLFGDCYHHKFNDGESCIRLTTQIDASWKLTDGKIIRMIIKEKFRDSQVYHFPNIETFNTWLDKQLERMKSIT